LSYTLWFTGISLQTIHHRNNLPSSSSPQHSLINQFTATNIRSRVIHHKQESSSQSIENRRNHCNDNPPQDNTPQAIHHRRISMEGLSTANHVHRKQFYAEQFIGKKLPIKIQKLRI
jgi:hypothetical protein